MKRNEKAQSILLKYKCKYNHFVMACYNIAFSCQVYRDFKDYKNLSYPYIITGDLKSKGTKFMLRRPDLGVLMFYEILESTITDYYSRFKYNIYKTIPETFNYIHLVEVRYIDEDECDIRSSLIYDNKVFLSEKELQATLQFKFNLYKNIEMSLKNYIIQKLAIANTIINNKIEFIWSILQNMKVIHKYSHLFADKINFEEKILKKNDIIELIDYGGKNQKIIQNRSNVKVNRCKISSFDSTKEGVIELLFERDEKNYSPFKKTKIILRIYEYKGNCSVYILYYFLSSQHYNFLIHFTKKKNKELKTFKSIIEKYSNCNTNTIDFNIEN